MTKTAFQIVICCSLFVIGGLCAQLPAVPDVPIEEKNIQQKNLAIQCPDITSNHRLSRFNAVPKRNFNRSSLSSETVFWNEFKSHARFGHSLEFEQDGYHFTLDTYEILYPGNAYSLNDIMSQNNIPSIPGTFVSLGQIPQGSMRPSHPNTLEPLDQNWLNIEKKRPGIGQCVYLLLRPDINLGIGLKLNVMPTQPSVLP